MQTGPAPAAQPRGSLCTLHDGRQVDSYSQDWALECLARWCLGMEFDERRHWIDSMPNEEARQRLRRRIYDIRQAEKARKG